MNDMNERRGKHVRAVWDIDGSEAESQELADFDVAPLHKRPPDHFGVYLRGPDDLDEWMDDFTFREAAERAAKESHGASIVDKVRELIETDDCDQTDLLVSTYENADTEARTAIDDAFTCLCGYSLRTLIEERGND